MKFAPAALLIAVLALSGCATAAPETAPTTAETTPAAAGSCDEVTLVVEFGSLDAPAIDTCVPAGAASDALASADIATEGTADYGDQVVCRVDDLPSPDVESCATLPANAYWALWLKNTADGDWEYAQEGVNTLQLTAGQSLGLVYTEGDDQTPPQD